MTTLARDYAGVPKLGGDWHYPARNDFHGLPRTIKPRAHRRLRRLIRKHLWTKLLTA